MSKKTVERLEELLEEKDEEIEELTARVDELERDLESTESGWSLPRDWEEDGLPVPRMEIHWSRESDYCSVATYVLVYEHFVHRVPTPKILAIPFGLTKSQGGSVSEFWETIRPPGVPPGEKGLRTPFRDGAHIKHDAKQLGLRAFITTEDGDATEMDLNAETVYVQTIIRRGKRADG